MGIVNVSLQAVNKYSKSIFNGTERPLRHVQERVLRLAGEGSDVTEVSMSRYQKHFVPIFEDPKKIRHLINRWSGSGKFPVVWKVCYWMRFDIYVMTS